MTESRCYRSFTPVAVFSPPTPGDDPSSRQIATLGYFPKQGVISRLPFNLGDFLKAECLTAGSIVVPSEIMRLSSDALQNGWQSIQEQARTAERREETLLMIDERGTITDNRCGKDRDAVPLCFTSDFKTQVTDAWFVTTALPLSKDEGDSVLRPRMVRCFNKNVAPDNTWVTIHTGSDAQRYWTILPLTEGICLFSPSRAMSIQEIAGNEHRTDPKAIQEKIDIGQAEAMKLPPGSLGVVTPRGAFRFENGAEALVLI